MELEEIKLRAGIQILMAARAHVSAAYYDQEADDALGSVLTKVFEEYRPYPTPVNYSVHWTTRAGPKVDKPIVDYQITVTTPEGKYQLVHDCTENG